MDCEEASPTTTVGRWSSSSSWAWSPDHDFRVLSGLLRPARHRRIAVCGRRIRHTYHPLRVLPRGRLRGSGRDLFFRGLVGGWLMRHSGFWVGNALQILVFLLPHLFVLAGGLYLWPCSWHRWFPAGSTDGCCTARGASCLHGSDTVWALRSPPQARWELGVGARTSFHASPCTRR